MQLSERLRKAAGLITRGNTVADVGCDHAYTSIYLCRERIAPRVIAMDVNRGPLKNAKQHVEEAGLSEQIELRLSDGVQRLAPGEADTILLCGMGGLLMLRILTAYPEVTKAAKELILQPQSEVALVRHFLHDNGYEIMQECMVKEDGKFYVMMRGVLTGKPKRYDRECEYLYGKLLIEEGNEVLKEFLKREHRLREEVSEGFSGVDSEKVRERRASLAQELEYIAEAEALMERV